MKEQSHPGKEILDQVSKDIPIMIMHVSGHLGCVNSAMLALAGIDSSTEDPQGGKKSAGSTVHRNQTVI